MINQPAQIFTPAERISSFKPYFFARLEPKIQDLKRNGMDVIRLDMGSPDLPPADFIIKKLSTSINDPHAHGYTPFGGTLQFKQAVADYYLHRFNVNVDPSTQVISLIGSKEGLFGFGQVLTNPGDYNLITDPCYPVYQATATIAGGKIHFLPLTEQNDYMPDLDGIPEEVLNKAKILWLNYPNNPTGAIATESFLNKAVQFAKKYTIAIAYDAPYTDVCFDGYKAPSILQIPGAMDVCVEFNSLSKTYNMAGWRIGMAVGNPELIRYLLTYKSQIDSSNLRGILDAGTAALTGDQSWIIERNQIYCERRNVVLDYLNQLGIKVNKPLAGLYVWFKLPDKLADDVSFCDSLLLETGVSLTPGSVYGEQGKGYVRICLATPIEQIKKAMDRFSNWVTRKLHS